MIDANNFMLFSLVVMRMAGFILLNPILGRRNVPAIIKTGFIMVLTYCVYSFTDKTGFVPVQTPIEYGLILLKEFGIGYVIGFVISLFLYIIIFGGEIMDNQMGLSMSKIYDASSNASLSLSATLYNIMFMLLFFTMDCHLTLIRIMILSQDVVPFGAVTINSDLTSAIIQIFCQCTILAIKFSLPIVASEFLIEMGAGILMKTIPQINVFVVSIQAKVFIGMLMLLLLFSPFSGYIENLITLMIDTVEKILMMMK